MIIIEIINGILIIVVGIIVYNQNTIIKKMKDFMTLFDIEKLQKSTEWIIKGEKYQLQSEVEILTKKIESIVEQKDNTMSALESRYLAEKDSQTKVSILKEMCLRVSRNIIIIDDVIYFMRSLSKDFHKIIDYFERLKGKIINQSDINEIKIFLKTFNKQIEDESDKNNSAKKTVINFDRLISSDSSNLYKELLSIHNEQIQQRELLRSIRDNVRVKLGSISDILSAIDYK